MRFLRAFLWPAAWAMLRLSRLVFRIWLRVARVERIEGLALIDLARGDPGKRATAIRDAARLIRQVQPYRLVQARRYLRRLVVHYTGGSGEYWPGIGACTLDADYIEGSDAIEIAMLIIHEAMHGRLDRRRIRTTSANVGRIERFCARAEVDFAQRLPGGQRHIERVRQSLDRRWWEEDAHHSRQKRRLGQYRTPAWLIRLYDRVMKPEAQP